MLLLLEHQIFHFILVLNKHVGVPDHIRHTHRLGHQGSILSRDKKLGTYSYKIYFDEGRKLNIMNYIWTNNVFNPYSSCINIISRWMESV